MATPSPDNPLPDIGPASDWIEIAHKLGAWRNAAQWSEVNDKAGLIADVAKAVNGRCDYGYIAQTFGLVRASQLLDDAAERPGLNEATRASLGAAAARYAAENFHDGG